MFGLADRTVREHYERTLMAYLPGEPDDTFTVAWFSRITGAQETRERLSRHQAAVLAWNPRWDMASVEIWREVR